MWSKLKRLIRALATLGNVRLGLNVCRRTNTLAYLLRTNKLSNFGVYLPLEWSKLKWLIRALGILGIIRLSLKVCGGTNTLAYLL
jgi:hypothetical protein